MKNTRSSGGGPKGPPGKDGEKGERGEQGPRGEQGLRGPPCPCSIDPFHNKPSFLAKRFVCGGTYLIPSDIDRVLITTLDPVRLYLPILFGKQYNEDSTAPCMEIVIRAVGQTIHTLICDSQNRINEKSEVTFYEKVTLISFGTEWHAW